MSKEEELMNFLYGNDDRIMVTTRFDNLGKH